MELEFQFSDNRYFAKNDEGKVIAEVTFPKKSDLVIDLNHTFVDDSLRGQGVAGKLVRMVCEYASENNLKIKPTCSYAAKWLDSHEEFKALVDNS